MELAEILRVLWRRRFASAAVLLCAAGAAYGSGQLAHSTPTGSATVQILVDSPQSALADLLQSTAPLTTRAALLAQVMASQTVLEGIAAAAHLPVADLTAQGPYSGAGAALDAVTPAEARSTQLLSERAHYRLVFLAQPDEPVVTVSVQGPTAAAAAHLAEAAAPGVQAYVSALQQQAHTKPSQRVTIRQLGPAQAATVNSSTRLTLMAIGALAVLLLGLLLLCAEALRRRPPAAAELERDFAADLERLPREERSRSAA
jgi:uncharacterized protein involved in exopolysaccharide biosynthesis